MSHLTYTLLFNAFLSRTRQSLIHRKYEDLCNFLLFKLEDKTDIEKLQEHGFQSIDEYPHLLATYPTKRADFNGEDLMQRYKIHQPSEGPHPSTFGRNLRKDLFGLDGLTTGMVDSENCSIRKEAQSILVRIFKGQLQFPLYRFDFKMK